MISAWRGKKKACGGNEVFSFTAGFPACAPAAAVYALGKTARHPAWITAIPLLLVLLAVVNSNLIRVALATGRIQSRLLPLTRADNRSGFWVALLFQGLITVLCLAAAPSVCPNCCSRRGRAVRRPEAGVPMRNSLSKHLLVSLGDDPGALNGVRFVTSFFSRPQICA
jgi:hypothetical protein